jgi:VTC domain
MILPVSQDFLSPSLRRNGRGVAAFELKFLVPGPQAQAIESWLAGRMQLDPHGDPTLGNAYRVNTVYSDTPDMAVYHSTRGYSRRKFRLRRYGLSSGVYLERKTKWGDRLVKRRTWAGLPDLERLHTNAAERDWPAYWFHRHLHARQLRPICQVGYLRTAYVGASEQGPIRLTIDRHLEGMPHSQWAVLPLVHGQALLGDEAILELKFATALPVLFRRLVYELGLAPNTVSKYRRAVDAWRLDGQTTVPQLTRKGSEGFTRPLPAREHQRCGIG